MSPEADNILRFAVTQSTYRGNETEARCTAAIAEVKAALETAVRALDAVAGQVERGVRPDDGDETNDADRYRWLVNHASHFDGTGDSDNMVRLWFYRPDGREVMVQGSDMDGAISAAEKERRLLLSTQQR
jgi:hypothetical protein